MEGWDGWMGWMDGSPGGPRYRAPTVLINGQNKSYQWPLALKFNSPGAILTLSLKYGFENCICLGRFNNT